MLMRGHRQGVTLALILKGRGSNAALPLCLAAMDACWIYAVAWLFGSIALSAVATFPVPSPVVLGALELAAWGLALYLLDRTTWPLGVIQVLSGLIGVAVAVLVALALNPLPDSGHVGKWIATAGYVLLVSLALWALGTFRARERPNFEPAYITFRLGLVVICASALLGTIILGTKMEATWAGLGGVAMWFVGWSLGALALANREIVREEGSKADMGFWSLVLAVSIGAVLVVGISTGAFGADNLLDAGQNVVIGILGLLGTITYLVLYAYLWLLSLLNINPTPLGSLPKATPTPGASTNETLQQQLARRFGPQQAVELYPELQTILFGIALLLVVVAAVWLVSRTAKRTRSTRVKESTEQRESFGSWSLLLQQARDLLNRLLARFRKAPIPQGTAAEDDLAALRGNPEWSGTLSVRQIYAHMQSLAAGLGYPRAPQQTPVEYLLVLSTAMPGLQPDLREITAAYLEARYGRLPASAPAVSAANSAWRRAEPALREGLVRREI